MITIPKKISIFRVPRATEYAAKNFKVLDDGHQKIGSSITGVRAMIARDDEMAAYLPKIIGVSPNSQNWGEKLENYWESMSIPVPEHGLELEVGFVYNENLPASKDLIARNKDICTSAKAFAEYVDTEIKDEDKYMYGIPLNLGNFILFRYCSSYKPVANNIDSVNKSKDIRFYFVDQSYMDQRAEKLLKLRDEAGLAYYSVIGKIDEVRNLLYAMGLGYESEGKTETQTIMILERIRNEEPQRLIEAFKDATVANKAFIERCIIRGLLSRQINSTVIQVTADNTILGNTIDEAVITLASEEFAVTLNTLQLALKAIPA